MERCYTPFGNLQYQFSNVFEWSYVAAGHLISEVAASVNRFADYTLTFGYDLTGNRLSQTKVAGSSTEATTWVDVFSELVRAEFSALWPFAIFKKIPRSPVRSSKEF